MMKTPSMNMKMSKVMVRHCLPVLGFQQEHLQVEKSMLVGYYVVVVLVGYLSAPLINYFQICFTSSVLSYYYPFISVFLPSDIEARAYGFYYIFNQTLTIYIYTSFLSPDLLFLYPPYYAYSFPYLQLGRYYYSSQCYYGGYSSFFPLGKQAHLMCIIAGMR